MKIRLRIIKNLRIGSSILFFIFVFVNKSVAQHNPFRFFKEEKSVTFGLNNRRTSFLENPATLYGLHVGVKFGNRLKHTLTLNSTLFWVGDAEISPNEFKQIRLNYLGFSEEFELCQIRKISFNSYFHIGAGKAHYRSLLNEIALENSLTSHFVFPFEFGLHTSYQLNTWSSFKLGMGYRYVIGEHEIPINGVYYKVGLGLNPNAFLTWFKEIRPIIDLFQSCGGFL